MEEHPDCDHFIVTTMRLKKVHLEW